MPSTHGTDPGSTAETEVLRPATRDTKASDEDWAKTGPLRPAAKPGTEAPDGGYGWCIVVAGFTVCFCTMGTIRSLGVFFLEFVHQFDTTYGKTSWITSILLSAMYGAGPLASLVNRAVGSRCAVMLGGIMSACGCMFASFATEVVYVYLTLGVITGFGFSLAFLPTMTMVGRYFDKRRTLANALAWLGACAGNFAFPPFFQFLIDCYGWRGALVVISGIALNCSVCGALLRPLRLTSDTVTQSGSRQTTKMTEDEVTYPKTVPKRCKMLNFSLLRKRQFVPYIFSFAFLYFGYYVPFVHLVPRAVYLGVGEYEAAFLISVLSVGDFVGRVVIGMIPEFPKYGKLHKYVIAGSMLGVCSLLCPLAVTYVAMLVHGLVYGFANGLIIPLTFAVAADLVGTKRLASAIGLLMMAEGVAGLVGPPVAGALYDLTGNYNMSFLTAGSSIMLCAIIMVPVIVISRKKGPLLEAELMDSIDNDDDAPELICERLTVL